LGSITHATQLFSETLSGRSCLGLTRRLSWGFQRSPLHRTGLSTSTPAWSLFGSRLGFSLLWLAFAKGRVLFRLRGFSPPWRFSPSNVLRVYCTPLPILGFAALRVRLDQTPKRLMGLDLPRRITLRSLSTPAAVQHVSMVLLDFLPSCRSSSENDATSGFFSASRVHEGHEDLAVSGLVQLPWVSSSFAVWTTLILASIIPKEKRRNESELSQPIPETSMSKDWGASSIPSPLAGAWNPLTPSKALLVGSAWASATPEPPW
jgi:hypothetical protein